MVIVRSNEGDRNSHLKKKQKSEKEKKKAGGRFMAKSENSFHKPHLLIE